VRLVEALGLPLFVKPANGGSSVGISKVRSVSELAPAMEHAFAHDLKVVVERGLDVREIECAVLGNDEPEAVDPRRDRPVR
jgi:D-alanine-D-alanine ligase